MPYVVSRLKPRKEKIDIISFLDGLVTMNMFQPPSVFQTTGTRTAYYDYVSPEKLREIKIDQQVDALFKFYEKFKHLKVDGINEFNYELQVNLESEARRSGITDKQECKAYAAEKLSAQGYKLCNLYDTFYRPKRSSSGKKKKWRRIDSPCDELMGALRILKGMFEVLMDGCTYHTAAFAYVPHRCAANAVQKHANNKSNWELKLDFSDFFGSITPEFTMKMLAEVFPFSEIIKRPGGAEALSRALSLAFLNGGLPQGTPLSPLLTNIIMIPIDQKISNGLKKHPVILPDSMRQANYVYTRYADDIAISNRFKFSPHEVENYVMKVLQYYDAPMKLNAEKTRFGSNSGANWMLGVMYNQDYEVTVGHRRKKRLKAALANYAMDRKNGMAWELEDLQQLQGEIAYCRSIESTKIDDILKRYGIKFSCDLMAAIKADIKAFS